jgi:PDZ domain-containing protein
MSRIPIYKPKICISLGRTSIKLGASWLIVAPACLWAIAAIYIPIFGPTLKRAQALAVASAIMLLIGTSFILHAAAHALAARITRSQIPSSIPLYLFGDAAQTWPAAASARREALVALAGPLASLLLAWLAYRVWEAQLHPYLDLIMLFLAFFNGGVVAVNLTPAFPLDGGRLLRVIVWGLLRLPTRTTRLALASGYAIAAGLAGWSIFLIAQGARFSLPTGGATLASAGLVLLALRMQPAWEWDRPALSNRSSVPGRLVRGFIAGLLVLGMLGFTVSLVPTNNGLEAPGVAPSVEPMVRIPPEHHYPSAGRFILTTVALQTPVLAGEWLYGQFSPAIEIVPPERIIPPDMTPHQYAQQQYRMLDESMTIAIAQGLRLAGYDVQVESRGAAVVSLLPDSAAKGILSPGDVIVALDGYPIQTTSELIDRLKAYDPHATVYLKIERDGRPLEVEVSLLSPAEPGGPPRIGITVELAGFEARLPFSVQIVPEKIVGGPSAGLMFTMAVYNLVTPEDLTGGRTIAGTGTINLDGTVGPIGGVQQKVAGAELAGAEYFLSPPQNYEDARSAARRIQVVKVATAEEAIRFLRSLPPVKVDPAVGRDS